MLALCLEIEHFQRTVAILSRVASQDRIRDWSYYEAAVVVRVSKTGSCLSQNPSQVYAQL